jgi:hypothetical protein
LERAHASTPFELLEFLCATLARRPQPPPFRLGAAVARYLNTLAYHVPPGQERQRLLLLSKVIWGRVFQFAKFQTAKKEEPIRFLQDFSQTHLANYNVAAAIETVRSSPTADRERTVSFVGVCEKDYVSIRKAPCEAIVW